MCVFVCARVCVCVHVSRGAIDGNYGHNDVIGFHKNCSTRNHDYVVTSKLAYEAACTTIIANIHIDRIKIQKLIQ